MITRRMKARAVAFGGAGGVLLFACSSTTVTQPNAAGVEGGACYANGTCNAGLACVAEVCVVSDGGSPGDGGIVDSGATDSGADAAPIDIAALPGLVLWVKGSNGVHVDSDGGVTGWDDLSPAANNMSPLGSGPLPTLSPTSTNGQPAVHMVVQSATVSSNLGMPLHDWGNAELFVEVVELIQLGHGAGILFGNIDSSNGFSFELAAYGAAPNFQGPDFNLLAPSATHSINDGVPHAVGIRNTWLPYDGGTGTGLELRIDGALVESTTHPVQEDWGSGPSFVTQAGFELDGDIAEIIAVKGHTSDEDVAGVEAYLKDKYNLP